MSAKSGLTWDLIVGGATALGIGALGWLEIAMARTPDAADASIREFGTLLTVLFGALAALWWNQSARLPNMHSDEDAPALQSQVDANILNGAAATFTVLSLFCSVFASSPWRSIGSSLSAIGALGANVRWKRYPASSPNHVEAPSDAQRDIRAGIDCSGSCRKYLAFRGMRLLCGVSADEVRYEAVPGSVVYGQEAISANSLPLFSRGTVGK